MSKHILSGANMLKSLLFWLYLAVSSAVLFVVACIIWLVTFPVDPRRRLLHTFTCLWAYHYIKLFPFWCLKIENAHRIDEVAPSIILANHQSMGDILVLFSLRRHFKWVAKKSLFKVPFIGWNMTLNGYVPLNRTGMKSIKQMMQACTKHLERGSSVLLFPEGTRSRDGQLQSFKLGAFRLACATGLPITPVVIDGTYEALPKAGWRFTNKRPIKLVLRVLDPIEPSVSNFDPTALSVHVRRVMERELAELRTLTVVSPG